MSALPKSGRNGALEQASRAATSTPGRMVYVMGPSGAGKDSLIDWVRAHLPAHLPLHLAQRTITRPVQPQGEQHHSVSDEAFGDLCQARAFALHWDANGLRYGIRHGEIDPLHRGHWVLVNGSRAYLPQAMARYPDLTVVHVTASLDVLRARLIARGRETPDSVDARVRRAQAFQAPPGAIEVHNDGALADAGGQLLQAFERLLDNESQRSTTSSLMQIRPYQASDEAAVVALWQTCGLTRPWNDPYRDIARKLSMQRELFLVGEVEGQLMATVMAGFDGHRGWVNYLAVAPEWSGRGFGSALMARVEQRFLEQGCPKVSLLVRSSNTRVQAFYARLGYTADDAIPLGKRLISDAPVTP